MSGNERTETDTLELAAMRQSLQALRKDFADLQARVSRLEVRDELMEAPGSAGDERVQT